MTHTTNPLVSPLTISNALTTYQKAVSLGVNDSLFTVNKFQTRFYKKNGEAINHDPNNLIRTQDLEPWYEENSCLYIFSAESFRKTNARIGQDPLLFEIPKIQAIDIDTHEDWAHAEILAKSGVINA
jgi:CMP-N-acetylneuraminic acid synthetase